MPSPPFSHYPIFRKPQNLQIFTSIRYTVVCFLLHMEGGGGGGEKKGVTRAQRVQANNKILIVGHQRRL